MTTLEGPRQGSNESDAGVTVMPLSRRAPRISEADVFQAADALLVEGHRPTIDRVRMRLGRGSPNTINDHLEAWWTKLGARLRDLPGREFPQLPDRVAKGLQLLWNEALEGAHEALRDTLTDHEHALAQREQALEASTRQLAEREHSVATRAVALEESLALARDQLSAANLRADRLETTLQEREAEAVRLRTRNEALQSASSDLQARFDAAGAAHQAERTRLEERHAAAEARWLTEVDRARQAAKDVAKEHERHLKEARNQIEHLQRERDHLRQERLEARAELKTAAAVREQLEARLHAAADAPGEAARTAKSKAQVRRKTRRTVR